jgi:hypothetical protein
VSDVRQACHCRCADALCAAQSGQLSIVAKPAHELLRNQLLTSGGERPLTGNARTRRAGGAAAILPAAPKRVIVDVREFMSQLPAVLHARGLEVVPVTLEVRSAKLIWLASSTSKNSGGID